MSEGSSSAARPLPENDHQAELQPLRDRIALLTAALEDVLALALSGGDYKERVMQMHRRAVAALSGSRPAPGGTRTPRA